MPLPVTSLVSGWRRVRTSLEDGSWRRVRKRCSFSSLEQLTRRGSCSEAKEGTKGKELLSRLGQGDSKESPVLSHGWPPNPCYSSQSLRPRARPPSWNFLSCSELGDQSCRQDQDSGYEGSPRPKTHIARARVVSLDRPPPLPPRALRPPALPSDFSTPSPESIAYYEEKVVL